MLTEQDKMWMKIYDAQPDGEKEIIDDAFREVKEYLEATLLVNLPLNDHAEALVAAITRYCVESMQARALAGQAETIVDLLTKVRAKEGV